jgi:hypothetical protein
MSTFAWFDFTKNLSLQYGEKKKEKNHTERTVQSRGRELEHSDALFEVVAEVAETGDIR